MPCPYLRIFRDGLGILVVHVSNVQFGWGADGSQYLICVLEIELL